MSAFYRPQVRRAPNARKRPEGLKVALALTSAALSLLTIAAVVGTLRFHSRFSVVRVVLEGVPGARRAEVEELTDAWIGRPVFFADLKTPIAALSTRSWVLFASARRVVPDTIEVVVRANPPVALARRAGELYTVDREGNWLGPYAGRDLAEKENFVLLDAGEGADEDEVRKRLARGTALVTGLKISDDALLSRVSEIEITPDGFALVDQTARVRLLFGRDATEPGRASAIWRAYLALRPELERHALLRPEADLRFADRIVLPPAEAGGNI